MQQGHEDRMSAGSSKICCHLYGLFLWCAFLAWALCRGGAFTAYHKIDTVMHCQGGCMKVAALGRSRNMVVAVVPRNESCSLHDTFMKCRNGVEISQV